MRIAINRCFGGFGLSHKAFLKLIERGWKVTVYNDDFEPADPTAELIDLSSNESFQQWRGSSNYGFTAYREDKDIRTNTDVLAVIEELGTEASGPYSDLRIIEIPDDVEWEITEYDGLEKVEEVHRSWF